MSVYYEWLVEEIDADGDITDVVHFNDAASALRHALDVRARGVRADYGVVRDRIDASGYHCRAWAYADDSNNLGTHFLDAADEEVARVPARFIAELKRAQAD